MDGNVYSPAGGVGDELIVGVRAARAVLAALHFVTAVGKDNHRAAWRVAGNIFQGLHGGIGHVIEAGAVVGYGDGVDGGQQLRFVVGEGLDEADGFVKADDGEVGVWGGDVDQVDGRFLHIGQHGAHTAAGINDQGDVEGRFFDSGRKLTAVFQ